MTAGLFAEFGQEDFSLGMVRATAWHKIPPGGAYDIVNALIDNDGVVYQRGPVTRLSAPGDTATLYAQGTVTVLSFSFGERVLVGGRPLSASWVPAAFTVPSFAPGNVTFAQIGDYLFYAGGGTGLLYGGAAGNKNAYSTGSVTLTNGSATMTGAGTSWLANVEPGMLLEVGFNERYIVKTVDTNTQITLDRPWRGTTGAVAYTLNVASAWTGLSAAILNSGTAVAAVAGKVLFATDRRVYVSRGLDPATGVPQPQLFDANSFHDFPAEIVTIATLSDRVFVFTVAGVYVMSNLAYDIVDDFGNMQHRVEFVTADLIARNRQITSWEGALLVAGNDGIYLMDAVGNVESLTRSIAPYYRGLLETTAPGTMCVFRDHLIVPFQLNGVVLVCRLDRPQDTGLGRVYPWTRLTGSLLALGNGMAVADPAGEPRLLAMESQVGYLLDATGIFDQTGLGPDPSGVYPLLDVISRQFEPDTGSTRAFVKDAKVDYVLGDASSTGAVTVSAYMDDPSPGSSTSASSNGAAGQNEAAPAPKTFTVGQNAYKIAVRIQATGAVKRLRLRGFRLRARLRAAWK